MTRTNGGQSCDAANLASVGLVTAAATSPPSPTAARSHGRQRPLPDRDSSLKDHCLLDALDSGTPWCCESPCASVVAPGWLLPELGFAKRTTVGHDRPQSRVASADGREHTTGDRASASAG